MTFRIRWLGRVPYREAWALQRAMHASSPDDHLLLLEHPHVYTLGKRADMRHVLVPPAQVGAELVRTDRGGDVTYHGPGQLVGYPIVSLPAKRGADRYGPEAERTRGRARAARSEAARAGETVPRAGAERRRHLADTVAYVRSVEQLLIDALGDVGLPNVGRLREYPGVWVDPDGANPRKIAAIGVRLTRGRSMHGFALNVAPDMRYWGYIVPCGIPDKQVTSLADEGIDVGMRDMVDAVAARATALWGKGAGADRQDVVWRHSSEGLDLSAFSRGEGPGEPVPVRTPGADGGASDGDGAVPVRLRGRLAQAGVGDGLEIGTRKPDWLRSTFRTAPGFLRLKHTMRDLGLVTVCEEAGCPNIFECWADGTATFMINGERCTRACGFCLVDTRHPEPLDATEPERVADAVERMGLGFAVVTAVARDDLSDGGAAAFAETIRAIRRRTPGVQIEVLVPDCKGDDASLATIFHAGPDVLNHNVETVPRLQRAVRPSAGYARSLSVLARAKEAELVAKSGLIVGMGESDDEVLSTLADLRAVGVDIVTIGQYLRPTTHHLPVARWVEPATFERYREVGEALGIPHVESSPLTRSSYHARQAAGAAAGTGGDVARPSVHVPSRDAG
ncbi:MAG TPA: lipoyl synthase [Acidimicrobiales bacterium]|jgi:lipoic acid synthetase|nr:lipoyl synthase [Acidimicrobiales bacterium]